MAMCRPDLVAREDRPDAVPAGRTRRGWAGAVENWRLELLLFVGLVLAYNVVRADVGSDPRAAFAHASFLVRLEGSLFDRVEDPLNAWMASQLVLAIVASYVYSLAHYVATPTILLLSRRHGGWSYWRGFLALVVASALALVVYATYPVAPPRLMPGLGIVDVLRECSPYGWWGSAASAPRGIGDATNQFAAMPSMHCGWALWCGIQMWGFRSPWWRVPAVAYPALMCFIVIATGNHFVVDCLGGVACVLAAYALVSLGRRLRESDRAGRTEESRVMAREAEWSA